MKYLYSNEWYQQVETAEELYNNNYISEELFIQLINNLNKDYNMEKLKSYTNNIGMYVDESETIKVFNMLEIVMEKDDGDFFSNVKSKDEKNVLLIDSSGNNITDEAYFNVKDYLSDEAMSKIVSRYPSELEEVLVKGLNISIGFFSKANGTKKINISEIPDEAIVETKKQQDFFDKSVREFRMSGTGVDVSGSIDRYFFRKHLLIRGKKGVGKTYLVDKRLEEEGIEYGFIAGHEGLESTDLLGYYVKNELGNLVWLDGVLSQAFRKAKDTKFAIFFDEILRTPARELNILVGALTPSSRGTFRLRTNRIINENDGIGETEILEVPVENLWVVGTTNVGAGYNVDDIDDALGDRFRLVNQDIDSVTLSNILNACSRDELKSEIPKLVNLYTEVNDFVYSGELEKEINLRHLCEVLSFAENKSEIITYINDLIPTWCTTDSDGSVNKAEREILSKLIKKIIKD